MSLLALSYNGLDTTLLQTLYLFGLTMNTALMPTIIDYGRKKMVTITDFKINKSYS